MLKKILQGIVAALGIVLLVAILYLQMSPTATTLPKPSQTPTNTAGEAPSQSGSTNSTTTINMKETVSKPPLEQSIPKLPTTTYRLAMCNDAGIKELGIYVLVGLGIASIGFGDDAEQELNKKSVPHRIAQFIVPFLLSLITVWVINFLSKRKEIFCKHQVDKLRKECEAIKSDNFDNELERLQHEQNSLQIQHDELSYRLARNKASNENDKSKQDLQGLAHQIEILDVALEKQQKQEEAYTEIVQEIEEDIKQITQQRDISWDILLSFLVAEAIFYLILWKDSHHYRLYLKDSCRLDDLQGQPIQITKLISVLILTLFAIIIFIDYKKHIPLPLAKDKENKPTLSKTMIVLMNPAFWLRLFAFYRINLIALNLLHTLPAHIMNNSFFNTSTKIKVKHYAYKEYLQILGSIVVFLLSFGLQFILLFSLTKRHLGISASIAAGYMAPYKDYGDYIKGKIGKALYVNLKHSTKNKIANEQEQRDIRLLGMCLLITMIIKCGSKVSPRKNLGL